MKKSILRNVMSEGNLFLALSDHLWVDHLTATATALIVQVVSTQITCCCPLCGQASAYIHSHYQRVVADVPCGNRPVTLHLHVRKFFYSTPLYNSVFRFDNEMFTTPHLFGLHDSKTQLQHLHCLQSDGIFANHLSHFEAIWAQSKVSGLLLLSTVQSQIRSECYNRLKLENWHKT